MNIKLYFLCLACILPACQKRQAPETHEGALSIIPEPVNIALNPGYFSIRENSTVYWTGEGLEPVAQYLIARLGPATGFSLSVKQGSGRGINLRILDAADEPLGDEGYRLSVTPRNIELTANQANGVFYGIQTLLQMLPAEIKSSSAKKDVEWKIGSAEIVDMPRFKWRGLMLDVSRHFFTKEEVMQYIDQLSEYKMNVFHWHLTDDQGWRIEIESLPRLTEIGAWRATRVGQWWTRTPRQEGEPADYGGYYSHEDIREIVQYAKERFVEIVPEIDVPGHALAAIAAYPEISCTQTVTDINVGNVFYRIDENTLCAGNELTFEYLDKIFTEVAMLFPSDYVHIGGDEVYKGFWQRCPKCQARMQNEGLKDPDELQSYFIKRVEKMLEGKNRKLIGWDEILEGGLAPSATVMSWRGMAGGIEAAKAGHEVIMTPNNHTYLDLYQGEPAVEPDTYSMCRLTDSYHFEPVPEGVDADLILGGQGNLWTESVPHFRHAEYMTWPRGWALAEVFWTPAELKNWGNFVKKTEDHFIRADVGGINYALSMYNAIIIPYYDENAIMQINLETEIEGLDIYYTFDNTDPDLFSHKYDRALSVPKDATWLKVITYRDQEPVGKMIKLRIDEIEKRIR